MLVAVQSTLAGRPGVLPGARALSHFGEHSAGLGRRVAARGAAAAEAAAGVADRRGRARSLAHAAAVVIKRVVKRQRPHHPAIAVNVGTPSRLSFPSAHATSTTAAAILLGRATGLPLPVAAGAADGVVPLGARRALPDRRAHRSGGRRGRRQDGRRRLRDARRRSGEARMSEEAPPVGRPAEEPRHRHRQGGPAAAVGEEPAGARRAGGRPRRRRPTTTSATCCSTSCIAFVAFSLAASSIYLVNDARDVEADRAAPHQALPPDRRGRGARVAGLRAGGGARRRVAGAVLVRRRRTWRW